MSILKLRVEKKNVFFHERNNIEKLMTTSKKIDNPSLSIQGNALFIPFRMEFR